ncbi:MAG: heavy-metal-associated domain-containing protein [Candidatus Avoscillospira sp.]
MSQASAYFTLGDLDDQHDQKKIKRELDTLPGVRSVSISDSSGRVAVDFDTTAVQPDQIRKLLEKMGYQITEFKTDDGIR